MNIEMLLNNDLLDLIGSLEIPATEIVTDPSSAMGCSSYYHCG